VLGQHPEVGEHLAEIYEKLGKRKEAEQTYLLALAAAPRIPATSSTTSFRPGTQAGGDQALADKILAGYEKLTGHKPLMTETRRLPNGHWTQTPYQDLTEQRMVQLGKVAGMSGWAVFSVVFSPGRVKSVTFQSGDQSMKSLTESLKAAHYAVEFPAGSHARLLRKAEVTCTDAHGCVVMLTIPAQAQRTSAPAGALPQTR